jgi:hypothetical protein
VHVHCLADAAQFQRMFDENIVAFIKEEFPPDRDGEYVYQTRDPLEALSEHEAFLKAKLLHCFQKGRECDKTLLNHLPKKAPTRLARKEGSQAMACMPLTDAASER